MVRNPTPVPTKINLYCVFSLLNNFGNARMKGMNENAKMRAVMVKIMNDIVFGWPESAIIRPRSLNKFPQKL